MATIRKRAAAPRRSRPDRAGGSSATLTRAIGPSWLTPVVGAALVALGLWAYAPSFAGVFLLDDVSAIARNAHIRSLSPLSQSMKGPDGTTLSGRPIAALSFAVSYATAPVDARDTFFGTGPAATADTRDALRRNVWVYHAFNLAVHLLAGLVLFGIARRTFRSPRLGGVFDASATWLAWVTAAVWVVHPLQTEAVTYVIQRVESLMGLFYLLTLYCAIRANDDRSASKWSWWTAGAIVSCALGMATKEVMVTAPIVVWLWDRVFLEPDRRPPWPRYLGLAATWIVAAVVVAGEARGQSVGTQLNGWTPWTYLLTETGVLVHYLRLAAVPTPLVFLYAWPRATGLASVLWPALLLVAMAAATIAGLVRRHPLGFVGAVFFLVLAPTSSLLPIVTEVAAEHRMYLPLAAISAAGVALAWMAISWIADRIASVSAVASRVRVGAGAALALLVLVAGGVGTRARNRVYASEDAIWRDTIRHEPTNERAHTSFGIALLRDGRYGDAESELRQAIALAETDRLAEENLGATLAAEGRVADAIPYLERALALWPDYPDAHRNLGDSYAVLHQDALAVAHLERARALGDADPALVDRLAMLAATSSDPRVHDPARAVDLAQEAVRATAGRNLRFLSNLAAAEAGAGRFGDAAATERAVVALAESAGNQAAAHEAAVRLAAFQARASGKSPSS